MGEIWESGEREREREKPLKYFYLDVEWRLLLVATLAGHLRAHTHCYSVTVISVVRSAFVVSVSEIITSFRKVGIEPLNQGFNINLFIS